MTETTTTKEITMTTANKDMTTLMESIAGDIVSSKGKAKSLTTAQRKDGHRDMLDHFDLDKLLEMQEKMVKVIDRMTANQIDVNEPGVLTPAKAEELMVELLDQIDIKDLLEVRREMIRAVVFAHLTEEARRSGDPEPEFATGSVPVPACGKKFVREEGGRSAAKLDETLLREALGARWEQVYDVEVVPEQVIPEHVEYTLDPDKVMRLAEEDPFVLEALRKSVIPGTRRTPRFTVRNL